MPGTRRRPWTTGRTTRRSRTTSRSVACFASAAHAYGTELGLGAWSFTTGGWHHVVEEHVLNTNGEPNGVVRVWYDTDPTRSPTFETTDLTYRTDATPISRVFFSTFFGGHDASWATPTDTFIEFAEFVVCR